MTASRLVLVWGVVAVLGGGVVSELRAQDTPLAVPPSSEAQLTQFRQQVEMWIRSGQPERAIELLEERRASRGLEPVLSRRLAGLYRETERYADLENFVLEENQGRLETADIGQLRLLAEARYRQGRDAAARQALDLILSRDEGDPSLLRLAATVLSQNGHLEEAVELLRDGRARAEDPNLFAQLLARLYSQLEEPAAAVSEYARVVVGNPLNVSLVRGQMLQLADRWPERVPEMVRAASEARQEHADVAQLGLLLAELHLRAGDDERAWQVLQPHLADSDMSQDLLRLALAGLADGRVQGSQSQDEASEASAMHRLSFSARIAQGLLDGKALPRSLQPRAWDTLTRTLMALIENAAFLRQDAQEQLVVLEQTREAILTMQRDFAGNRLTASALLRLADLYSTSLHRPQRALEIYRRITDDPGASREDVQLARMGVAEAYVALGDTATARTRFDEIGQDMSFVEGQGKAHYYLGQIDFMGGHFDLAEDRLKAVAAESPRANFANDALDLALVLAEEKMNAGQDRQALGHYGQMLYHRAVGNREGMRADLLAITGSGVESPLKARARLDLADLDLEMGNQASALEQLEELQRSSPASRHMPTALERKGEVLESLGRMELAMRAYERVLIEYDDYVYIDRVRDRIRELESQGFHLAPESDGANEEELP